MHNAIGRLEVNLSPVISKRQGCRIWFDVETQRKTPTSSGEQGWAWNLWMRLLVPLLLAKDDWWGKPITQIAGAIGSGSPALKVVFDISHWLVPNVDDAVMPGCVRVCKILFFKLRAIRFMVLRWVLFKAALRLFSAIVPLAVHVHTHLPSNLATMVSKWSKKHEPASGERMATVAWKWLGGL